MRICFTEVRFLQTYSPLWSQRPGLFQPFPSLKRSLGPSELLFSNKLGTNLPARTTTQLLSLALLTNEMITRKSERRKQSKRKSSKEHNKSLSLNTKAFVESGEDLITKLAVGGGCTRRAHRTVSGAPATSPGR
jgi:hypothetical protein